jgi:predicted flavoprotein YhiN
LRRHGGAAGRRVVVLDHAEKPGKKILISGGGRCNFTNLHTAPDRYLSENRHFARSALSRYTPADFLELVERHGIAWHEKTLGQLFAMGRRGRLSPCCSTNACAGAWRSSARARLPKWAMPTGGSG